MYPSVKSDPLILTLVGSPNSGKTTLYNWLTGSKHRAVNYPGATVEFSRGWTLDVYNKDPLLAIDTPGVYSLDPKSPDEEVTWGVLFEHPRYKNPHVVVAVVDATLLSRQLLVVKQLQQAGFQVVVALTMLDLARADGYEIDVAKASELLGVPVVSVDGRLGGGVQELVQVALSLPARGPLPSKPVLQDLTRSFAEIDELCAQVGRPIEGARAKKAFSNERLDGIFLHRLWGPVLFALLMGSLFTSIFWVAKPFMDFIDDGFSWMAEGVYAWAPGTLWADFLANGLIAGLGSVLVFVPQIMILFVGLMCLEDSGYLARAATLADQPLSKVGLNGRSFVPLLSAYACAIPAMLSARTISSRRERWLTLFIIPLMTCSARLPVYALLLGFVFHNEPPWKAGLALAGLYFLSLLSGALASVVANRFLPIKESSFFILELPPYRKPHLRKVLHSTWERTQSYLRKAAPVIFAFSLLIWVATTFPNFEAKEKGERLQKSWAAQAGHVLEPVMSPMGADWRVGVGLLSAFAAREVFVSSMAIVFHATAESEEQERSTLITKMQTAVRADGSPLFTTASVTALILFFMIALQCMSTVTVSLRESGRWQFALLQLVLFNLVAYALAVGTYQLLKPL